MLEEWQREFARQMRNAVERMPEILKKMPNDRAIKNPDDKETIIALSAVNASANLCLKVLVEYDKQVKKRIEELERKIKNCKCHEE